MYPEVLGIWPMGAHCSTVDVHGVHVDVQIAVGKQVWVGKSQRDFIDAQGMTVAWITVRVETILGITTGRVGLLRTRPRMRTGACVLRRRARLGAHTVARLWYSMRERQMRAHARAILHARACAHAQTGASGPMRMLARICSHAVRICRQVTVCVHDADLHRRRGRWAEETKGRRSHRTCVGNSANRSSKRDAVVPFQGQAALRQVAGFDRDRTIDALRVHPVGRYVVESLLRA